MNQVLLPDQAIAGWVRNQHMLTSIDTMSHLRTASILQGLRREFSDIHHPKSLIPKR